MHNFTRSQYLEKIYSIFIVIIRLYSKITEGFVTINLELSEYEMISFLELLIKHNNEYQFQNWELHKYS